MIKYGRYVALVLVIFCGMHGFAQKVNFSGVPQVVIDAIRNNYPNGILNKIKKKKGRFVAIMFLHDKKTEATFAADGSWQKTITYIEWKDLPDTVRITFRKSDYWQWQIEEIKLLEMPKKEGVYFIAIKDVNPFDIEEFRPGSREYTICIAASGQVVKTE